MYKDENLLIQKLGRQRPFKVPEGYFDDFANNIMNKISAVEGLSSENTVEADIHVNVWYKMRRYVMAASVTLVLGISSILYFSSHNTGSRSQYVSSGSSYTQDEDVDQMADYAMIDNEYIYASLSDNQ